LSSSFEGKNTVFSLVTFRGGTGDVQGFLKAGKSLFYKKKKKPRKRKEKEKRSNIMVA
jgi:hypothetical protein